MDEKAIEEDVSLYPVNRVVNWRSLRSRGATPREFVGENPASTASIYYSLDKRAKEVGLVVIGPSGDVIREFPDASGDKGLHLVEWDLRRGTSREDQEGNRRFRRGRSVGTGTYTIQLTVEEEVLTTTVQITNDPLYPENAWDALEESFEEMLEGEEAEIQLEEWDD